MDGQERDAIIEYDGGVTMPDVEAGALGGASAYLIWPQPTTARTISYLARSVHTALLWRDCSMHAATLE